MSRLMCAVGVCLTLALSACNSDSIDPTPDRDTSAKDCKINYVPFTSPEECQKALDNAK